MMTTRGEPKPFDWNRPNVPFLSMLYNYEHPENFKFRLISQLAADVMTLLEDAEVTDLIPVLREQLSEGEANDYSRDDYIGVLRGIIEKGLDAVHQRMDEQGYPAPPSIG